MEGEIDVLIWVGLKFLISEIKTPLISERHCKLMGLTWVAIKRQGKGEQKEG